MLRLCVLSLLICSLVLCSQAPVGFVDEADLRDDALLRSTLSVSISPEDIHHSDFAQDLAEKQADEMQAASQRRLQRQEKRIQQMQAAVNDGKAKAEELTPLLDEMHLRIETGRIAKSSAPPGKSSPLRWHSSVAGPWNATAETVYSQAQT